MNFQPLKDFMDGYLPMLGVPGTDIVIYKDHEEIGYLKTLGSL